MIGDGSSVALALALSVPGAAFAAAAAAVLIGLFAAHRASRLWLLAALAAAASLAAAAVAVLAGGIPWEWTSLASVGGEAVRLRLDSLGAFFLLLLSVVGGAGSLYQREYWSDRDHPRSAATGRFWWILMLASMSFVLIATNGLHFLLGWELFTVSAYFLITCDRSRREVRSAGWLYLMASHASTLALFAFFAGLAVATGSWELGSMRTQVGAAPLFWLAIFGFGLKAGAFPLHIWLPSAHANAPSHVSAILSGVAIKMGIFGLVRFSGWMPMPDGAGWVIAAMGVVSAVLGVAFALGQHDLKRLLAYHSVENIGIILIGLGFAIVAAEQEHAAWGRLALAGALLHTWNHGLFKSLLFLGAGSVVHATGTRTMSLLGGLWRSMPWTAGLFVLGAAAIAGIPPLNGFVSEWLVFLGLFGSLNSGEPSAWTAVPAAVLLGVTGALALACFVKVCGVVFLGLPRSEAPHRAHEPGWRMRAPMLLLAFLCVAIGLAPAALWPALSRASDVWAPAWAGGESPASLVTLGSFHILLSLLAAAAVAGLWLRVRSRGIERAVTWDCGYHRPTPRMQYTAGSFAGIITGWFGWILRPERRGHEVRGFFPSHASREGRTPETVLERLVNPAGGLVMRVAMEIRRLQHGRIQAYMFYLLIGLVAIAVLAVAGGKAG
ncbi:MAG TPA: proton-conducting transporter membrane subunit [Candidatus Eisenbacteria bacterium]|nr:proton-conducting transporter membrane subunit [Candidatus Eisenbacteria bacterium]